MTTPEPQQHRPGHESCAGGELPAVSGFGSAPQAERGRTGWKVPGYFERPPGTGNVRPFLSDEAFDSDHVTSSAAFWPGIEVRSSAVGVTTCSK